MSIVSLLFIIAIALLGVLITGIANTTHTRGNAQVAGSRAMTSRDQRHLSAHMTVLKLGIVMAEHQKDWFDTHPSLTAAERRDYVAHLDRLISRHGRELVRCHAHYRDTFGLRARVRRYVRQLRGYNQEPSS